MNIKITMKDGTIKKFLHEGRPGGSYTKHIKYEPGFVVVEDEWGKTIAIPQQDIQEIETTPIRY